MTITTEVSGPIATVTLNRPEARNALTSQMLSDFELAISSLDANEAIRVIVLTGADPAFCAGLDLKDLANTYGRVGGPNAAPKIERRGLSVVRTTPMIGAINGPAVTGGLELALGCDFLIGSHRATFADTHGRVGILPGGGMTIRLPQLIGINRARQMSLTGMFIDAGTAAEWGLLNEVVPHGLLMERTLELANQIAEADSATLSQLLAMYATNADAPTESYRDELRFSRKYMAEHFDDAAFATKRDGIISRGSKAQRS
jgi:enoyl-CoA hydratase